ncbi:MAG: hypothetical protein L3J10_08610 [Sulfurimonas sp.]|nr:hypothetical protein [Sulfurimonas sp.]
MNKTIMIQGMLLLALTMFFVSCAEAETPKQTQEKSEKVSEKILKKTTLKPSKKLETNSEKKVSKILPANYLFEGDYIKIHSPNSTGWSVLDKSNSKVIMGKKDNEGSYEAKVIFFPIYIVEKKEFYDLIKNETSKIKNDKRYSILSSKLNSTEKRGYPCVETKQILKAKTSPAATGSLIMQINALYCKDPKREGAGFMVGYSFRGQEIIEDIDIQADSFIEGVQFPSL